MKENTWYYTDWRQCRELEECLDDALLKANLSWIGDLSAVREVGVLHGKGKIVDRTPQKTFTYMPTLWRRASSLRKFGG
jgi:hypothetical protein